LDGGKTVTDNVDGGIICEQNCRVWREDKGKIIDEGREEGETKYRALGNTRGREARRRVRVSNTSDVATIQEI